MRFELTTSTLARLRSTLSYARFFRYQGRCKVTSQPKPPNNTLRLAQCKGQVLTFPAMKAVPFLVTDACLASILITSKILRPGACPGHKRRY